MKGRFSIILFFSALSCLSACQQGGGRGFMNADAWELASRNKRVARTFEEFISSENYGMSRDMWRGNALQMYDPKHSRVEILLAEQRGRLFIHDQIAMDFPVCSGRVGGHETPRGRFRITEKKREHRSTLYGNWVNANDDVVQTDATPGKKAPAGTHFRGALMPYWMRFNGAIGMHVGSVYRSGASHGCVRIPPEACSILFDKLAVGSLVIVK